MKSGVSKKTRPYNWTLFCGTHCTFRYKSELPAISTLVKLIETIRQLMLNDVRVEFRCVADVVDNSAESGVSDLDTVLRRTKQFQLPVSGRI
jgi:hypothetical protein